MSCAYLIEGENGPVLVDTGGPGAEGVILRKMRSLGHEHLRLIFLTHAHFDHYGSAAALRRMTDAPVAIHRQDADALALGRTEIGSAHSIGKVIASALPLAMLLLKPQGIAADILLDDGDRLDVYGLEAKVVHTPGHTAGSSSLLYRSMELDGNAAFVGDLITASGGGRAHAQRFFAQDWEKLEESVRHILELDPHRIYGGHGFRAITGQELMHMVQGE
jgi:hydroxyacylglutathione hydrolase